jgi:hypothetical protein
MTQYYIHGELVTPREIMRPMNSPLGKEYGCNVLTYQGKEYDIIWNGIGDGYILIDGKKRYLEEQ